MLTEADVKIIRRINENANEQLYHSGNILRSFIHNVFSKVSIVTLVLFGVVILGLFSFMYGFISKKGNKHDKVS